MERLVVCEVCKRHVKISEAQCPFCASSSHGLALVAAALVGVGISLASCGGATSAYGPPPGWEGGVDAAPDAGMDAGTDADGGLLGAYGPPPPQDGGAD